MSPAAIPRAWGVPAELRAGSETCPMPSRTEELGAERPKSQRGAEKRKERSAAADGKSPSPAEHAAYLQALTENNPLGIVVLDLQHRVLMCNPAFETLFGYQQSEILGAELDSLLAPGEFDEGSGGVDAAVDRGKRGAGESKAAAKQRIARGCADSGSSDFG